MSLGYLYQSVDKEAERLRILNEIYNKNTLSELSPFLTKSARVLEIGPGVGLLGIEIAKGLDDPRQYTGLDQDPKQVERAKAHFAAAGLPVDSILHGSVLDIDAVSALAGQNFDVIYCRWVVAHIPVDRRDEVLAKLYTRLIPGGRLICEEGDVSTVKMRDSAVLEGDPGKMAFDHWYAFSFALEKLYHLDLRLGCKISEILASATKQPAETRYFQPLLASEREKMMFSYAIASTQAAVEQVIKADLMPFFDAEKLEEDLVGMARDGRIQIDYIQNSFAMVQSPC